MRALTAALAVAGAAASCAPPPPPVAPRPAAAARGVADPAAVAALLRLEDRRDFDAATLAALAADQSPAVRERAALALGRLRRAEGLPLLRTLLADPDSAVAATAAFAIGQVGDSSIVVPLTRMLAPGLLAGRPTVASEAAYALGKLHSREAGDSLLALLGRAALTAPADPIGSALLAVWHFSRPASIEPVSRWLASPSAEIRWRAAYALVRRPDPRATALLARSVTDADPRVRALAVRGLTAPLADTAGLGATAALPTVVAALRDADYSVRINAARTLGGYSAPGSVAALTSALANPDRHLVIVALESLGALGPRAASAADGVRRLAADDTVQIFIRQTALESLAKIRPAAAAPLAEELAHDGSWRLRASTARAFAAIGGARDPRLLASIEDPDARVAAIALGAALEAAGDSVRPLRAILLQSLASRDVFVRATALGGLATMPEASILPQLLDAYDLARRDTLDDAGLAAIDALGALQRAGLRPGRAFFVRFPRSADPLVRLRAAHAFGEEAKTAWGDPLPIDTGRSPAAYRALVDRFAGTDPRVEIVTDAGTIQLRLFGHAAPLTVESFLALARRGYFDGQEWPRVVPNFVVQGGDPRGDTNGGPGYAIRDEIDRHRYRVGTLGMALSGPDTGGSQFFITHSAQPHLDGTYAIFGEVVSGQAIAERILPGDRIVRIRVIP